MLSSVIHCTKEDENKRACAKNAPITVSIVSMSAKWEYQCLQKRTSQSNRHRIVRQPSSHRETKSFATWSANSCYFSHTHINNVSLWCR